VVFAARGSPWVAVNSDGMRDRDHAIEKRPGRSIAVLGDSMTEAMQVPQERTSVPCWRIVFGDAGNWRGKRQRR